MDKIGVFGGTFNPIHLGHLRCALEVLEYLELKKMLFVPSKIPPHKATPTVSPIDRVEMIKRAIAPIPYFQVDDLELHREGPSYSVPTLMQLKTCYPNQALCFILGQDAFNQLHTWFEWEKILQLCHLIVLSRPCHELSLVEPIATVLEKHQTTDLSMLSNNIAGKILTLNVTELAISSSSIRTLLSKQKRATFLLPAEVEHYILTQQLYRKGQDATSSFLRAGSGKPP